MSIVLFGLSSIEIGSRVESYIRDRMCLPPPELNPYAVSRADVQFDTAMSSIMISSPSVTTTADFVPCVLPVASERNTAKRTLNDSRRLRYLK